MKDYLRRHAEFSARTFGPGKRTKALVEHIEKELRESFANPDDLNEWIDIIILALDGYWRHGGTPASIMPDLEAKLAKNIARKWPAPQPEDQATEHKRTKAELAQKLRDLQAQSRQVFEEWGQAGEGDCTECAEAKRIAYSDATTPGFFRPFCAKHDPGMK